MHNHDIKQRIAARAARELQDGDVVNLGIGLPTLVSSCVPSGIRMILQSENGLLGMGPAAAEGNENPDITNAGAGYITAETGASFFDSAQSFAIIRGGHVDLAILGALQVDAAGSLASHIIPGKMVSGMGGAMDLACGARRIIVVMTHTAKDGSPKILSRLTLPATARERVDMVITELAVIRVTEAGLVLEEIAADTDLKTVISLTEAELKLSKALTRF